MGNIIDTNVKRVLTLKSKLGFGKYENLSIEDVIKLSKNAYLRWVYFNYANIDFIPEILDTIQIPIEYRLKKPSKNPEFLNIVNEKAVEKYKFVFNETEEAKEKRMKVMNTLKAKKFSIESKASLQRKNHGIK